ncbi:MAG: hypothetical protein A2268_03290 [Candidatus Raymondbacteria bacterium RifOxyA12_full_50_37]|nr:MAG: hypothetical protein A2268_03290 [Candidatus Raymondbacteria bacterium RifOxyA12_full_50_37]OGJ87463.1 MAG: hypothetical protein A2248_22030 [Candidatus Raymondbacteria bacterium RIFOXYA2_FULL_49_16]OGJ96403.1 MAG: hypothetical protein A2453_01645 [Candidatus Raymondbacteria bacterium RIFOXYC2_FULL_50_21]OGK03562.1 MAG: hypothetical protein A2350_09835 [Candidatus Raymondbacteria bacterium RifOxyB12_full_50_8]OGP41375.1 MAG: hypothetical protein A2324_01775 [Candidatus Raymondbacteria b
MRMPSYSLEYFRNDLSAALTNAIVALPQSMAYALIAGIDPVYGLYTAIVSAIVGSLFGSSNHLITGPTNASALLIAGTMRNHFGEIDFYNTLFLLTFLVGVIRFSLGLFKVGKLINFVSRSVIVGFAAGAGIIIGLGQLNEVIGIALPHGYHPLYEKVFLTLSSISASNWYALGFAGLTVAIIITARKINRNIPGALLALVCCGAFTAWFNLEEKGVRLIGEIPAHLPKFTVPEFSFEKITALFSSAFAIALIGLVEALSIAKSISLKSGQKINANREFMGQGLANIVGSFFSCFASSGSFTRSAINFESNAKTRMAGIMAGILVAVILCFFGSAARFIPKASLAGVIIMVAYGMVDKASMRKIAVSNRHDLTVMILTILATVSMPDLRWAILSGIIVSVIVHLWNTGEIRIKLLRQSSQGHFRETDISAASIEKYGADVPVIHIEGDLYFGSASDLEEKLNAIAGSFTSKVFILRLKRVNVVDISALEKLEDFIAHSIKRNNHILLCGVSAKMKRFIDKIGITAMVGEENVFPAENEIYASSSKAYQKAQSLIIK